MSFFFINNRPIIFYTRAALLLGAESAGEGTEQVEVETSLYYNHQHPYYVFLLC